MKKFCPYLLAGILAGPTLAQAQLYVAPAPDALELRQASEQLRPWRFAVTTPMRINAADDGAWESQGDERIWRARVASPGALSLSLHFDQWQLPEGAVLSLFDAQGTPLAARYDASHNARGELWTALVVGDSVDLVLRQPAAAPQAVLSLASVMHGFRGARPASAWQTKANPAGSCNIDVACAEADDFSSPVRASVLVQIGGTGTCSGSLINNTDQDLRPFVLTADHCQISRQNENSIVIYFDYQRSRCERGGNRSDVSLQSSPSLSGAEFLADKLETDFTLLIMGRLNNPATVDPSIGAHWAGWTRSVVPAQTGASVHHPSGDEKSIALFDQPLEPLRFRDAGTDVEVWRVVWSQGTTEQGSSGSGIFGADNLLRGQLFGGEASCQNRLGDDYYGRFDLSWDSDSCADRQLAFWLDPGNFNPQSLAGIDRAQSPVRGQRGSRQRNCSGPPPATPTPPPADGGGGGSSGLLAPGWLMLLVGLLLWRGQRRA